MRVLHSGTVPLASGGLHSDRRLAVLCAYGMPSSRIVIDFSNFDNHKRTTFYKRTDCY